MRVRNHLYDSGYFQSFHFQTRVISVGNLRVGGTGKTPMVEYLIRLLRDHVKVTTLSRGYGRKSKGFKIADKADTATTLGDEPFQYYSKFPEIKVTVGEERAVAIPFILAELPETELILMDDAFQHRTVKPDHQILVTEYSRPFFRDLPLPAGRLREPVKGVRRADSVIISKCPDNLSVAEMDAFLTEIQPFTRSLPVYFTCIEYGDPIRFHGPDQDTLSVVLMTGIGNPQPMEDYVRSGYQLKKSFHFADHHKYTIRDIQKVVSESKSLGTVKLFMTEKDMVKLIDNQFENEWHDLSVWYIPIKVRFLRDADLFNASINSVATAKLS